MKRATICFGNKGAQRAEAQWEHIFYVMTSRGEDVESIKFDAPIVEADLLQIASTPRWQLIRNEINRISTIARAQRLDDYSHNIGSMTSLVGALQWLHIRVKNSVLSRTDLTLNARATITSCLAQWEISLSEYLAATATEVINTAFTEAAQEEQELAIL